jgi:GT2 family glycosyltransferase
VDPGRPRDLVRDGPLVGVVILNWNDGPRTIACAESVLASTYHRFFVVLVDNGSTDGSPAMLSRWVDSRDAPLLATPASPPEAQPPPPDRERASPPLISLLLLGSNGGYGAGNNAGIAHALRLGADASWVLNNDTVVDPPALAQVVDVLEGDRRVGLVGSCVVNNDRQGRVQCLGGGTYGRWTSRTTLARSGSDPRNVRAPESLDFISGSAMLISTACLRSTGGFEEGFFLYCEEIDLTRRAAAAGWSIAVAEKAIVRHEHGASAGSHADVTRRSPRSFYYGARSAVLLARKTDRVTLPSVVLARIAFAATLGVRGHGLASRAVMRGVRAGLRVRAWSATPSLAEVRSVLE